MFWYNYDSGVLSVLVQVDNCNKLNYDQAQKNNATMLNDEIIPNSFKISLLVIMKVCCGSQISH
jgi:hypothetical protein